MAAGSRPQGPEDGDGALLRAGRERADRVLAWVLMAHWPVSLAVAAWRGSWGEALWVGAPLALTMLALARVAPGRLPTRLAMGAAYMGYSALLIHQMGGLIEMHFHIFVSLAFFLMYRDWRVPVAAAVTVAAHHAAFHWLHLRGVPVWIFRDHMGWDIVALHAGFVVMETAMLVYLSVVLAGEARQATQLVTVAERLSRGDLTLRLERGPGAIGLAVAAMNDGTEQMAEMIRGIRDRAGRVASLVESLQGTAVGMSESAGSVARATERVTEGAHQQLAAAQSTSTVTVQLRAAAADVVTGAAEQGEHARAMAATVAEMVRAVEEVARRAATVSASSQRAADAAREGAAAVERTVSGMARVRDTVLESSTRIAALERSSTEIGRILRVIGDMAMQTNMLSLNAAVEAARAGEQGRGFAVVADEVRTLALRSRTAADDIAALVTAIQHETGAAAAAMQLGTTQVAEGNDLAAAAGSALDEILAAVEHTVRDVATIADAATRMADGSRTALGTARAMAEAGTRGAESSRDMADGAEQVGGAVDGVLAVAEEHSLVARDVADRVREITASMTGISESTRGLARIADELATDVGRFVV